MKNNISEIRNEILDLVNDYSNLNFKPEEFPCLVQSYINSDVNGLKLKFVFAYKKDCKKLIDKV